MRISMREYDFRLMVARANENKDEQKNEMLLYTDVESM